MTNSALRDEVKDCVVSENAGSNDEAVVDWTLSDVVSDTVDLGDHHFLTVGRAGIGYFGLTARDSALQLDLAHAVFRFIHQGETGQSANEAVAINPHATFVQSGRRWAATKSDAGVCRGR